jgi:hypothetical protein
MIRIEILETTKRTIEVDVDFPIYRIHDLTDEGSRYTIYSMIKPEKDDVSKFIEYSIHLFGETQAQFEIKKYSFMEGSDLDYKLGREEHSSNRDEFIKAYNEAMLRLIRVYAAIPQGE